MTAAHLSQPTPAREREADRRFYADDIDYFSDQTLPELREQIVTRREYIRPIEDKLAAFCQRKPDAKLLELGAGTSATSLDLIRLFPFASATCCDISEARMRALAAGAAHEVGGDLAKLHFVELDMGEPLPFEDGSFDLIVFDAALHHTTNMWRTLSECRRALAPGGALVALREQYLARLTSGYALRRILASPEVRAGVSENAYLRQQYEYYLRVHGFTPHFHAVAPGRWRLLAPLNGLLFSKWTIWADV